MPEQQVPTDEELAVLIHGPVVDDRPVPSTGGRVVRHADGQHRYPPPQRRSSQ